ncbi:kinase-like domain-containing protein [Hypoxylon sp. NC1633]|nr:kinase-like domain-containing protein [Hypoxylon sp. NC1633]
MMATSSDDGPASEYFGPLVNISEESLVLLASNIRKRSLNAETSGGKLVARLVGSYNLVYIVQLDDVRFVIRVPITGWGSGKTETAARALESQTATMRLIAQSTTIPVPQVYSLDTTDENEIGAPYICMSFIPGRTVSSIWFEDPDSMSREDMRLKILGNLSGIMAQLSQLRFKKLGSLFDDPSGSTLIGPCYDWHENEEGTMQVESSGPFDSTPAYIMAHFKVNSPDNQWTRAETEIMSSVILASPLSDAQGDFVLCHPDFSPRNIIVDKQGNITGLIDWDFVQTVPQCVGYASYPNWITRDWDPLLYGWPVLGDSEDSPEALERYRAYYNEELGKALSHRGDWKFTEKSHITQAVWTAALHGLNRWEICRKLIQVALGADADAAMGILSDIGTGDYNEKDLDILNTKLRQLVALNPDEV